MNHPTIKGFNYQPSYGTSGLDIWLNFNAHVIEHELGLGKQYFPKMNAIRLWLSWDAYKRSPAQFCANFETALSIADQYDLKVMPVLFNRWHTKSLDYGGIYIDHFLPGSRMEEATLFDDYLNDIVGGHKDDDRIFVWDLCNEPFFYSEENWATPEIRAMIAQLELQWLERMHAKCKAADPHCLTCVGVLKGALEMVNHISDILTTHHYSTAPIKPGEDNPLDQCVAFAQKVGKQLILSETCWGSYDDAQRVGYIKQALEELNERHTGWLVYLLHNSGIADAHDQSEGAFSNAGNLSFINADGTLRSGHEVINDYF
jgi:hypothetical protein